MQQPTVCCVLTILFQDPFWIGLFECTDELEYAVARQVFGGEPSDPEVYAFVLERFSQLEFSQPIEGTAIKSRTTNFKRAMRQAKRVISGHSISTKAQQALQAELERKKQGRKEVAKQEREAEKELRFLLRQQKRKEKHRGH